VLELELVLEDWQGDVFLTSALDLEEFWAVVEKARRLDREF